MRTCFLILSLATFASCGKKTNEINIPNTSSAFISEKALVIPHDESGSIIRPKLLNKIVQNAFPGTGTQANSIIHIHDEFHKMELSEGELKDYEIKEKILTKVIVSYSDREEVYFLREGIPAEKIIQTLKLKSEDEHKLKLIPTPYRQTFNSAVFYIASVNHKDLMINDQKFYNTVSEIKSFQDQLYFESYKAILLKVNYEFRVQALAPVTYTAPKIRCTKDLIEAGACGDGCSYTTNLPASYFEASMPVDLQDLGLAIAYDDTLVKVAQLPVLNIKPGYFEVEIDSLEIIEGQMPFQFLKLEPTAYKKIGKRYNFSSGCNVEDRAKATDYTQNSQTNFKIEIIKLGRGEELKKIIL